MRAFSDIRGIARRPEAVLVEAVLAVYMGA
jgi:hypothetical protein